ncbi:MAG: ATP-binding protein [Bacteroidota bacterium]
MIPAKGEKLDITSTSENIRLVERLVEDVCDVFNLNEDNYGNILIAVTEAVNNAIKHGNRNDSSKNVALSLSLAEGLIKFKVEDEGSGFDYHNLPDPTTAENLEKPGGRGIFLMKHLADEVEFADNGKVVELSFYMNS